MTCLSIIPHVLEKLFPTTSFYGEPFLCGRTWPFKKKCQGGFLVRFIYFIGNFVLTIVYCLNQPYYHKTSKEYFRYRSLQHII